MKTPIRAIAFDLGETLLFYRDTPLNWAASYPAALAQTAAACNLTPSPQSLAAAIDILSQHNTRLVPRSHEIPAEKVLAAILAAWNAPLTSLPIAMEAFFSFFQQRMSPYPETLSTLTALRSQKIPLGILTDVPYGMPRAFVLKDLQSANLANLFDVLLTSVDVGQRKPQPVGFLALAKQLNVPPPQMLYIGNEPKDITGAAAAGAIPILINRDHRQKNFGQSHTLSTLTDLLPLLAHHQEESR